MVGKKFVSVLGVLVATISVSAGVRYFGDRLSLSRPGSPSWLKEREETRNAVASWPEKPRRLAEMMLERYGPPEWSNRDKLIWRDKDPWKRVIVHREYTDSPLEQVVNYHVPLHRLKSVLEFKNGIRVEAWYDDLSASSDRESLNFLVLNLADDIVSGRRTPAQARRFHRTEQALSAAGKSSPYLTGLLFLPHHAEPPNWGSPVYDLR